MARRIPLIESLRGRRRRCECGLRCWRVGGEGPCRALLPADPDRGELRGLRTHVDWFRGVTTGDDDGNW